ncbi:MAG: Hsp20/alpha crystallin family protein [Deltaproteobacteria bacterium]|jgi:HSP20 family protein|nr:Hsp20/alpha crystallin family protein [Deltaproteobacteria bacterium]
MFGLQFVSEMENFQREMDQLFHGLNFRSVPLSQNNDVRFKVSDQGESYIVEAPLPGLDIEKLDISILGRTLTVTGDFMAQELPADVRWHRQERNRGQFKKTLQLAVALDADAIVAEYQNGMLKINLPKAASALPKKISVKVG